MRQWMLRYLYGRLVQNSFPKVFQRVIYYGAIVIPGVWVGNNAV